MGTHRIYAKQHTSSLADIAAKVFRKTLLKSLQAALVEQKEIEAIEQIRDYLIVAGCTTPAYQKLLDIILRCKWKALVLAVELLFNKSFKFFYVPPDCEQQDRLAKAIASNCDALEFLDISQLNLSETHWHIFEDILRNCRCLRVIKLPEIPDNEFWLPLLSTYCPELRHLGTPNIYGLKNLVTANFKSTLMSIEISNFDFDSDEFLLEVAPIIKHCPNITSISSGFNLDDVLRQCLNENANFCCNLKNIILNEANEDFLKLLIAACPQLMDFNLNTRVDCSLQILGELPLQRFDVTDFDFQDLLQLLRKIGHNLEILQLRSETIKSLVNVRELLRFCPQLSRLKLVGVNAYCIGQMETTSPLKQFHMRRCSFAKIELINFLSGLQKLEEFYASEIPFTDDDMQRVFCQNAKTNFEEFFVREASNLTIRSVYNLLHFCPNLKYIGKLSGWNINVKDIESIRVLKNARSDVFLKMYVGLFD